MNSRMLSWLVIGALFAAPELILAQDTMRWQPNLEAAQRLAAQTHRLVLIHFCGSGCQPCARMDAEVFSLPATGQGLAANFISVRISRDESPQTTQMFNVRRIPTDMIVTPDNRVIARFEGFQPADQYVATLNRAAEDYRRASQPVAGYAAAGGAPNPYAATAMARSVPGGDQPPTQAAYSSERYAEYLNQPRQEPATRATMPASAAEQSALAGGNRPPAQAWAPTNAPTQSGAAYTAAPPQQGQPAAYVASAPATPGSVQPAVGSNAAPPFDPRTSPTAAPAGPFQPPAAPGPTRPPGLPLAAQLPPGSPPLALDGYCCVTLIEAHLHKSGKMPWQPGNPAWGAIHNGRTYLFVGRDEQQKFLANPNAFAPALDGNDPVAALDQSQAIPGSRKFGLTYQNRIYLFSNEDNLQRFVHNQSRYAADVVQARR